VDVDWRASRGLERNLIATLSNEGWPCHGPGILMSGATGCGKSWHACALAQQAARMGFSALYTRAPRVLEQLRAAHVTATLQWHTRPSERAIADAITDRIVHRAHKITLEGEPLRQNNGSLPSRRNAVRDQAGFGGRRR
jgi:DNA replication protein DnaC